jgi:hypothetical protein
MFHVPKMMYGPRGWADLDDYRLVRDEAEAAAAARDGYFRAGEDAREDLVAAGKWPIVPRDSSSTPVVSGEGENTGHKRRGRPRKG